MVLAMIPVWIDKMSTDHTIIEDIGEKMTSLASINKKAFRPHVDHREEGGLGVCGQEMCDRGCVSRGVTRVVYDQRCMTGGVYDQRGVTGGVHPL